MKNDSFNISGVNNAMNVDFYLIKNSMIQLPPIEQENNFQDLNINQNLLSEVFYSNLSPGENYQNSLDCDIINLHLFKSIDKEINIANTFIQFYGINQVEVALPINNLRL